LSAKDEQLREALAYVVRWIRTGEGDEATAAELADAALAAAGNTPSLIDRWTDAAQAKVDAEREMRA
jgi:hypothetical protein